MNRKASPVKRPGELPEGYEQALYWKISERSTRLLIMNLLAIPLLVLWGSFFFWLAYNLGRLPQRIEISSLAQLLIAISALFIVLVLHELIHGAAMRIFGATPQYGVMWNQMMFYATSPGFAYPRAQYLAIALAPLATLSLLAVLAMALLAGTGWVALLAFAATFNAVGAVGDMWITAIVLRYPVYAYVVDEQDGMRIFLPASV